MLTNDSSTVDEFMQRVESALKEPVVDRDKTIALLEEAFRLKREIQKRKQEPHPPCI